MAEDPVQHSLLGLGWVRDGFMPGPQLLGECLTVTCGCTARHRYRIAGYGAPRLRTGSPRHRALVPPARGLHDFPLVVASFLRVSASRE
jgi:hypothetical protein